MIQTQQDAHSFGCPAFFEQIAFLPLIDYNVVIEVIAVNNRMLEAAFRVGKFFVSDIYLSIRTHTRGYWGKFRWKRRIIFISTDMPALRN